MADFDTNCIAIVLLEIIFQIVLNVGLTHVQVKLPTILVGNWILLIFTSILLYGTITKKRAFLWSWIVINVIIVFFFAIWMIIFAKDIAYAEGDLETNWTGDLAFGIVSLVVAAIKIVYILIVYRSICKLRDDNDPERERLIGRA